MDVPEGLLSNELQQLGDMLQIVSYELTVLHDFMKENYGARYESFRKNHSKSQPRTRNTQWGLGLKRERDDNASLEELSHDEKIMEESEDVRDGSHEEESRDGDGMSFLDMQMEEYAGAAEGTGESMGEGETDEDGDRNKAGTHRSEIGQRPRRPKKAVWSKFIISRMANGKPHAKCRKCLISVSCKVERLTSHYQRCSLGTRPLSRPRSQDPVADEEAKLNVLKHIKSQGGFLPASSARSSDPFGRGRKVDPVWSYFETKDGERKKPVTCKKCGVEVSSKVERVRRHFILCNELDKEESNVSNDPT